MATFTVILPMVDWPDNVAKSRPVPGDAEGTL
jgi:hypothetical protein